jgi:hypothetical protein
VNETVRAYRRKRKEQARALIAAAKASGCSRCHREFEPRRLHFHHRDPSTKLFAIAKFVGTPTHRLSRLVAEIAKCDVLCLVCHGKESAAHRRRDKKGRFT